MFDKDYYVRRIQLAQADIEAIKSSNLHNEHLFIELLNSKIANWKNHLEELASQ
ncbi:hypothetical protein [Brevibacillus borstelensis]|uniref:hypothetical protein n=1 Tax=Brevibacillus borstelensis TaxID=45462 RepID=UPI001166A34F|nr:hypothetical protein [Brevibacillus borstelensis]MED1885965.1 hypothetical protein [Brevibacillus borstelensis]GED55777.1 hypothetical protein BBO01nite_50180 [Brevibacillus borstelensis]